MSKWREKNFYKITRGEVGGDNGGEDFQEQVQRTHGQNQGRVELGDGGGDGWAGG